MQDSQVKVKVVFEPSGKSVEVSPGVTFLEAAASAGIQLQATCGGKGSCGKCALQILEPVEPPQDADKRLFTPEEIEAGLRLGCQAVVLAPSVVRVPASSLVASQEVLVEGVERHVEVDPPVRKVFLRLPPATPEDVRSDLRRLADALGLDEEALRMTPLAAAELSQRIRASNFRATAVVADGDLLAVEEGDTSSRSWGIALDIGTTTVAGYLIHLPTGKLSASLGELNGQAELGADVIARLEVAVSQPDGLRRLNQRIQATVNDLIARACQQADVKPDEIYELVAVGNSTMMHLFLGVPPDGLAFAPYVPAFTSHQERLASDLGLIINPRARVYTVPGISGFVGADTTGVILATQLDRLDGVRLAIDLGTNGEVVAAQNGTLVAVSTAAGPAFEGARISCGMSASMGAIDSVVIDDDVRLTTIDSAPPRGLCGSGLVDAVAQLTKIGVILPSGRMARREEITGISSKVAQRLVGEGSGAGFVLATAEEAEHGRPVTLTARDVRELQLAKAAVCAGVLTVLEYLGIGVGEVEELLLAGAFGHCVSRESAVAIGLVPGVPVDRIRGVGNAAGAGARLALMNSAERSRANEIARRTHYIELCASVGFYEKFEAVMQLSPIRM